MLTPLLTLLAITACDSAIKLDGDSGLDTGTESETDSETPDDDSSDPRPGDADGDGSPTDEDCDDADPTSFPGGDEGETADGVDQDCSGLADDVRVCDGAYGVIQEAIDAAPDGFTVAVCPGHYTENLRLESRSLRLLALEGPEVTILDGGGAGTVILAMGCPDLTIEGFTVEGGVGVNGGGVSAGSSVINLVNLVLQRNMASGQGGGAYLSRCTGELRDSVITENSAVEGGGVAVSGGTFDVLDSEITANTASPGELTWNGALGGGGGLWVSGRGELRGLTIADNTSEGCGGGLYTVNSGGLITESVFEGNTAYGDGGGAYLNYTTSEVSESRFEDNVAGDDAGGLRLYVSQGNIHDNVLINNSASDDGGGAKFSHSKSQLTRNTFIGNQTGDAGGGIELDNDNTDVLECVFEDNTAARGGGLNSKDNTAPFVIKDSVFYDNTASEGGGLRADNNPQTVTVLRGVFDDNRATLGAGIYSQAGRLNLRASVVTVSDGDGITLGEGAVSVLRNVTSWGNQGAGLVLINCGAVTVQDTIFADNGAGLSASGCQATSVNYSLVFDASTSGTWSPPAGSGNLSADPLLTDPASGDFTLQSLSPAKDAGDPSGVDPDGSRADMGAHGGPDAL
ncbi:MAG: right-handed parallel beta-helix repeat-containing protein [Deltaproteobacteria bacterium]|nr:right-handed parallel beta-helix repeat-containing protein [Deltaproteobacteria bacterium]